MHNPWFILPQPIFSLQKAVIIGAGLAGSAAAYSLARRGWDVTVLEQEGRVGAGASGNSLGIVTPLITHRDDRLGQFYWQAFAHAIKHFSGVENIGFQSCGMVHLSEAKSSRPLEETVVPQEQMQQVSLEEACAISGLALKKSGVYLPDCAIVSPIKVCEAHLRHPNITLLPMHRAVTLQKQQGKWQILDATNCVIANAPVVIVATASNVQSFDQLNWLPMQRVRGQITFFPEDYANSRSIICYDKGYLAPSQEGITTIGATYNRSAVELSVSQAEHEENIRNLRLHVELGEIPERETQGRASFRASLPDRRAAIGPVPDRAAFLEDYKDVRNGRYRADFPAGKYLEGLYLSVGHGSRGLISCPIGGELLAAMICGEALPLPGVLVDMLNPARFVMKEIKQG